MLEQLNGILESPIGFWEALVPVVFSLLLSLAVYMMYRLFYSSRYIGAGVNRTFLIGGPAITMLFLVIQASVPLGLGLLGALSFIRFRTPVKDPAEVGFILLMIAGSIGAATGNYVITGVLFTVIFLTLGAQWLMRNRTVVGGLSHMVIALDQPAFKELESKLNTFLRGHLPGLRLETMSMVGDRVNLHYQYQKKSSFDGMLFTRELESLTGTANVEVFIG
jgi:hypothetical protein